MRIAPFLFVTMMTLCGCITSGQKNSGKAAELDVLTLTPKDSLGAGTALIYKVAYKIYDYNPDVNHRIGIYFANGTDDFLLLPLNESLRDTGTEANSYTITQALLDMNPNKENMTVYFLLYRRSGADYIRLAESEKFTFKITQVK